MTAALRAEWAKLRTTPDLAAQLALAVLLTVAGSATAAAAGGAGTPDPVHLSLLGVQVGQAVLAIAGVQAMAGEFGSGLIRASLLAVPRRATLFGSKALLLAAAVGGAAVVAVLGSVGLAAAVLPVTVPLDASLVRGVTLAILYLVLIALLGLGAAAAVRNAAAAAGFVLGLLYLVPVLLSMFPDPAWRRALYRLTPATAGQAMLTTRGMSELPLGPWAALGVVAGWAAGMALLGGYLLHRRDA